MSKYASDLVGEIGNVAFLNGILMILALKKYKKVGFSTARASEFDYYVELNISTSFFAEVFLLLMHFAERSRIGIENQFLSIQLILQIAKKLVFEFIALLNRAHSLPFGHTCHLPSRNDCAAAFLNLPPSEAEQLHLVFILEIRFKIVDCLILIEFKQVNVEIFQEI
ncbi:hypothetical protein PhaeoP30_01850 [Phaeobacter inhibens]|nr:hypothetical protein PhaeoP30_01850 [Phaeobacter inhibens]